VIARLPASPTRVLDWIGNAPLGEWVQWARARLGRPDDSQPDDVHCHDGRGHPYGVVENAKSSGENSEK
jgi:hypothetical protein